eukprot:GHVT01098960.1.p1 GENE.GHVT01098960.1~~GHVT01098960.1.p1  ORF type:complete len:395 (+),score=67.27 GHVT01098960.1:163-1185(+)
MSEEELPLFPEFSNSISSHTSRTSIPLLPAAPDKIKNSLNSFSAKALDANMNGSFTPMLKQADSIAEGSVSTVEKSQANSLDSIVPFSYSTKLGNFPSVTSVKKERELPVSSRPAALSLASLLRLVEALPYPDGEASEAEGDLRTQERRPSESSTKTMEETLGWKTANGFDRYDDIFKVSANLPCTFDQLTTFAIHRKAATECILRDSSWDADERNAPIFGRRTRNFEKNKMSPRWEPTLSAGHSDLCGIYLRSRLPALAWRRVRSWRRYDERLGGSRVYCAASLPCAPLSHVPLGFLVLNYAQLIAVKHKALKQQGGKRKEAQLRDESTASPCLCGGHD